MAFLFIIVSFAAGLYFYDLYSDRTTKIKIIREIEVYSEPEAISGTPMIGSLKSGDPVKVLRIEYGKQFRNIKVQKEDGFSGWIIDNPDYIKYISK